MAEEVKRTQFKVDRPPVFAEEVFISSGIKVSKTKKATGFIRLQFADLRTTQIIADIVVDPITCEGLINILKTKLEEIDKVMKSSDPEKEIKKITKQQPIKVGKEEETTYTG